MNANCLMVIDFLAVFDFGQDLANLIAQFVGNDNVNPLANRFLAE